MSSTRIRWIAPLIFLLIMFGGVGIAQATGHWVTSGRQTIQPGQQLTVDDLKGWMTLGQAVDGLGMEFSDLVATIDPPAGTTLTRETAFKDLEAVVPGFEMPAFREKLRAQLAGAPASSTKAASATPTSTLEPGTPTIQPSNKPTPTGTGTGAGKGASAGTNEITGKMTLREVGDKTGLDPKAILRQAGLPEDTPLDTPVKELVQTIPGFEIQVIRDAVEALR